ncbi:MAG: glycosyltransferase family 9 protein [Succinivibrio sp.]|nr:glycosyltransferase family 9 protein [Succinivibrio sp.]
MFDSNLKSLCVLRLTALGDCINAFGLIGALRQTRPELELCWIIDERFASLFRDARGQDLVELIPVSFKKHSLPRVIWQLRHTLKTRHFDALLNLQTSIKASLCSLAVRAPLKLGYDAQRAREGQSLFTNLKVPSPRSPHVLAGFMAFAQCLGQGELTPYWDFKLSQGELDDIKTQLPAQRLFTIAPCSAKAVKNWTADGYAALAQYALQRGFAVILCGSNAEHEREMCHKINYQCANNCLDLCGKTNLRQLAALLKLSSLVLSPDSAAMHLASALGTPVIGLFAIHNPQRVGPWKFMDLNVSVYEQQSRLELGDKGIPWRYRVKNEQAMQLINPEQVKNAFDLACRKYLDL